MKNVKILNTKPFDVCVDLKGEGKSEDRIILHPKNSIVKVLSNEVFNAVKSAGLTVQEV